jgi:cytochrome P450
MLKTKFDNYPKGKKFSAILGDLLGRGIFNVDGDCWKFQRKMASLELGSVSIRSYAFEVVKSEIGSRLIPLLCSVKSDSGSVMKSTILDLQDVFRRFSFDSICKFSFGVDPGCLNLSLPNSNLAASFDLASKLSAERAMSASPITWKIKRLLNVGSEKRLAEAIKSVNLIANDVIKRKRESKSSTQQDLLGRFMNSISDDSYLRDIIKSFLLAGRDTVASALTSFFWLLTNHPEVESTIRAESDRIMGENKEIATFEQMRELHYLHGALYESMRLYPPVQFDSKFCQNDDVLHDGTFVKKGTRVTYHPYAMGRMEKIWGSDCLEFKPERWLQNGVFKPESLYKYPVFQGGLRVCLGKELALVEMKSVALALIRRFDIRPATPSKSLRFAPGLSATINGGLPVVVRERMTSS